MSEATERELFKKRVAGCPARELAWTGDYYCSGQFMTKCKAENCFVVKFAIRVISEATT
jgi:hypothetical protein